MALPTPSILLFIFFQQCQNELGGVGVWGSSRYSTKPKGNPKRKALDSCPALKFELFLKEITVSAQAPRSKFYELFYLDKANFLSFISQ